MEDDILAESRTRQGYQLGLLKDRLSQPNWNFSRGHNSFAGYSEGVCLLGGIDPTESFSGSEGIGWQFLPGGLEYYGFQSFPSWDEAWQLDAVVKDELDRISALELKGLRKVGDAIKVALQVGITMPWLAIASQDEELTKILEQLLGGAVPTVPTGRRQSPTLMSPEPSRPKPSPQLSEASRKKANRRWQEDDNKKLRNQKGRELFEELLKNRFEGCKSRTGNVKKSKIRDRIFEGLEAFTGSPRDLPAETTIDDDVNRFLGEYGVDLKQYMD